MKFSICFKQEMGISTNFTVFFLKIKREKNSKKEVYLATNPAYLFYNIESNPQRPCL